MLKNLLTCEPRILNCRPNNSMQREMLDKYARCSDIPTHLVINTLCHLKVLTDKPSNQNELINSITNVYYMVIVPVGC